MIRKNLLHSFREAVLDGLFPKRCALCRDTTQSDAALCSLCWTHLRFIEGSLCGRCGLPFEIAAPEGALCGGCVSAPPLWSAGRAALVYGPAVAQLVSDFKFRDRTHLAPSLSRWMYRVGQGVMSDSDYIVPAPLHWTRRISRRYNQSAELAKALTRLADKSSSPTLLLDALVKTQRRPPQVGLSRTKRLVSPNGSISCNPQRQSAIAGARILLIDDVYTTGATLRACALALKAAKAQDIKFLTLARVV